MVVIGITGPTGAGKTTVLNVLTELGGAVVDCDEAYHELLRAGGPMKDELRARFGPEIFDENGDLRRKELGAIVFEDPEALSDLNAITHRHIIAELKRLIAQAGRENRPAIMAREGISEDYARARVRAQKPAAWFEARCTHTLRNDKSQAALEARARALFQSILCKEDL